MMHIQNQYSSSHSIYYVMHHCDVNKEIPY